MSQYNKTEVKNKVLRYYDEPVLKKSADDTYWTIEPNYHQRPDKLARELYGNESYYYVFLLANKDIIEDPIFGFVEGLTIRVPNKTNVRRMS